MVADDVEYFPYLLLCILVFSSCLLLLHPPLVSPYTRSALKLIEGGRQRDRQSEKQEGVCGLTENG